MATRDIQTMIAIALSIVAAIVFVALRQRHLRRARANKERKILESRRRQVKKWDAIQERNNSQTGEHGQKHGGPS